MSDDARLPEGKTCKDCRHFEPRCSRLIHTLTGAETSCDWSPSRFRRRRCVGFGPTEGRCENEPGTPWSPYWCEDCDAARREHITEKLRGLAEGFREP